MVPTCRCTRCAQCRRVASWRETISPRRGAPRSLTDFVPYSLSPRPKRDVNMIHAMPLPRAEALLRARGTPGQLKGSAQVGTDLVASTTAAAACQVGESSWAGQGAKEQRAEATCGCEISRTSNGSRNCCKSTSWSWAHLPSASVPPCTLSSWTCTADT